MAYPLAQLTPSAAPSSSPSSSPSTSPPSPLPSASGRPSPSGPRPRATPDRWLTQLDRWLMLFARGLTATALVSLFLRYLRRHPELAERLPPDIRDYVVRGRFDVWEAHMQRQLFGLRRLLGKGHPFYPCMRRCCRDVVRSFLSRSLVILFFRILPFLFCRFFSSPCSFSILFLRWFRPGERRKRKSPNEACPSLRPAPLYLILHPSP